jgi:hypothetical protein
MPPVVDFPPTPHFSLEPTQSQLLGNLPFENQDADLFSFLDNLGQNVVPGQGANADRAARADLMSDLSWGLPGPDGGLSLAPKAGAAAMNGVTSSPANDQAMGMPAINGTQQQYGDILATFPGSAGNGTEVRLHPVDPRTTEGVAVPSDARMPRISGLTAASVHLVTCRPGRPPCIRHCLRRQPWPAIRTCSSTTPSPPSLVRHSPHAPALRSAAVMSLSGPV